MLSHLPQFSSKKPVQACCLNPVPSGERALTERSILGSYVCP
ncbi:hypothetical protein DsansV1_C13g0124711 [Dioscorea sansibarensis]